MGCFAGVVVLSSCRLVVIVVVVVRYSGLAHGKSSFTITFRAGETVLTTQVVTVNKTRKTERWAAKGLIACAQVMRRLGNKAKEGALADGPVGDWASAAFDGPRLGRVLTNLTTATLDFFHPRARASVRKAPAANRQEPPPPATELPACAELLTQLLDCGTQHIEKALWDMPLMRTLRAVLPFAAPQAGVRIAEVEVEEQAQAEAEARGGGGAAPDGPPSSASSSSLSAPPRKLSGPADVEQAVRSLDGRALRHFFLRQRAAAHGDEEAQVVAESPVAPQLPAATLTSRVHFALLLALAVGKAHDVSVHRPALGPGHPASVRRFRFDAANRVLIQSPSFLRRQLPCLKKMLQRCLAALPRSESAGLLRACLDGAPEALQLLASPAHRYTAEPWTRALPEPRIHQASVRAGAVDVEELPVQLWAAVGFLRALGTSVIDLSRSAGAGAANASIASSSAQSESVHTHPTNCDNHGDGRTRAAWRCWQCDPGEQLLCSKCDLLVHVGPRRKQHFRQKVCAAVGGASDATSHGGSQWRVEHVNDEAGVGGGGAADAADAAAGDSDVVSLVTTCGSLSVVAQACTTNIRFPATVYRGAFDAAAANARNHEQDDE